MNKRQDKNCFFLRLYYREVKSIRLIENSHNTTLSFLFGGVLTDEFSYGAVLTENKGRFGLGPVFDLGRFDWQPCLRTCAVRI